MSPLELVADQLAQLIEPADSPDRRALAQMLAERLFQVLAIPPVPLELRVPFGNPFDPGVPLADWCLAMVGEAGEAANVVKKIHRQKYGLRGRLDPPIEALVEALAEELADVFLYLDLLAVKAGIDLPAAIVAKFNKVSERQGFPDRLPAA